MIKIESNISKDQYAFHSNVSREFENELDIKETPTNSDLLVIEDAATGYSKKKVYFPTSTPPTSGVLHYNESNEIHRYVPVKPNPVITDLLIIEDSQNDWDKKAIQIPYLDSKINLMGWNNINARNSCVLDNWFLNDLKITWVAMGTISDLQISANGVELMCGIYHDSGIDKLYYSYNNGADGNLNWGNVIIEDTPSGVINSNLIISNQWNNNEAGKIFITCNTNDIINKYIYYISDYDLENYTKISILSPFGTDNPSSIIYSLNSNNIFIGTTGNDYIRIIKGFDTFNVKFQLNFPCSITSFCYQSSSRVLATYIRLDSLLETTILYSDDDGETWHTLTIIDNYKIKKIINIGNNKLLFLTDHEILISSDGGLSVEPNPILQTSYMINNAIYIGYNIILVVCFDIHIGAWLLVSFTNGVTWENYNIPYIHNNFNNILFVPSSLYIYMSSKDDNMILCKGF